MSSTNKLLQEAIADAKAVKETALANARLSLEEMFKPQIESMVNKKLTEVDDDEETVEDPTVDDAPAKTTEPAQTANEPISDIKGDTLNIDLSNVDDADSIKTINIDLNEPEKPTEECDTSVEETTKSDDTVSETEFANVNLDDIANEGVDVNADDDISLEGIQLEDDSDDDDIIDIDLESLIMDDDDNENENVEECDVADINNESSNDDIDITVAGKHVSVCDADKCDDNADNDELEKANKKLSDDLEEAYNVIKIMRKELSESTLTNAKLMYANKLFSKFNLTNEQKLKVLDKFDQAKSLDAAKLIYGTINESLSMVGAKTQKSIKESFASKRVGSTKPKQTIVESTEDMQRNYLMKLAGIK